MRVCRVAINFTWNHAQLSHARCQPAVLRHGAGRIPPSLIHPHRRLDVSPYRPPATRQLSITTCPEELVRLNIEFSRSRDVHQMSSLMQLIVRGMLVKGNQRMPLQLSLLLSFSSIEIVKECPVISACELPSVLLRTYCKMCSNSVYI